MAVTFLCAQKATKTSARNKNTRPCKNDWDTAAIGAKVNAQDCTMAKNNLSTCDDQSDDIAVNTQVQDFRSLNDTLVTAPRVGGVDDGVAWPNEEPEDMLCLRPTRSLREKFHQHELLKTGLDKDSRLKIDTNNDEKQKVNVNGWATAILISISAKGFDTVFRMHKMTENGTLSDEVFIIEKLGSVKTQALKLWIKTLNAIGGMHGKLIHTEVLNSTHQKTTMGLVVDMTCFRHSLV